jgi:hypothetical protein
MNDSTDRLQVERLGGFAGFGLPGSALRSRGELTPAQLSKGDREAVDALFAAPPAEAPPTPDGFRYRLTRHRAGKVLSVEVAERHVPASLRDCVQDELG